MAEGRQHKTFRSPSTGSPPSQSHYKQSNSVTAGDYTSVDFRWGNVPSTQSFPYPFVHTWTKSSSWWPEYRVGMLPAGCYVIGMIAVSYHPKISQSTLSIIQELQSTIFAVTFGMSDAQQDVTGNGTPATYGCMDWISGCQDKSWCNIRINSTLSLMNLCLQSKVKENVATTPYSHVELSLKFVLRHPFLL